MGSFSRKQRKTFTIILGGIALGMAIAIGLAMWGTHELFVYITETIR